MSHKFTGNIIIFHSFDVGEDINLERVKNEHLVERRPFSQAKYFKNYHIPLVVALPAPHANEYCDSAKLHNFGVITLRYTIPFHSTLEELRLAINAIEDQYLDRSVYDAGAVFKTIKSAIKQARFFHLRKSYVIIQVNPEPGVIDPVYVKDEHGSVIASMLRFETETLSEYQKNEILASAFGYYRGDLNIIDTDAAFIYDDEYEGILDLFEFANIQQLELQYYDRIVDQKLNQVYESDISRMPIKSYLPFWLTIAHDPVAELSKLRVDISVITERLENSIKLASEPYYSELYDVLVEKLDIKKWRESLNNKLDIAQDIGTMYQNKVEVIRHDMFSMLIIILIFMEFIVAILAYFK